MYCTTIYLDAIYNYFYKRLKWFVKQPKYTKQSDKELNTLLTDKIFVSPRDFFNV